MTEKTIETLVEGETLLSTIKRSANDTFQVEIVEFVTNTSKKQNVPAAFMAGHAAFNSFPTKPRRAYQSATAEGLLEVFGIEEDQLEFESINGKEVAPVNMLNPELNGERLHICIEDSMNPTYQGQTPKMIKKDDGTTSFFMKEGQPIYSSSKVVLGEPTHTIINSDERVSHLETNTTTAEAVASEDMQLNA